MENNLGVGSIISPVLFSSAAFTDEYLLSYNRPVIALNHLVFGAHRDIYENHASLF